VRPTVLSVAGSDSSGGAGIQAARMLVKLGVSVVLTGQCGPNAFNTLAESGVWVVTGCSGEVQQEFEKFRADLLGTSGAEDHPTAPRGRSIGKASRKTDGETPGGGQTGRRRGPDGGRGDDDGVERIGPARARSGN